MKDTNKEYKYYKQQLSSFTGKNGNRSYLKGWEDLDWIEVYNNPDNFEVVTNREDRVCQK